MLMKSPFSHKTYRTSGEADTIQKKFISFLESSGLERIDSRDSTMLFRYPSLFFSSKRPLTCISRLTTVIRQNNGAVDIQLGVSFTKIRFYTIALIAILCFLFPALISYVKYGRVEIPLLSYIGIPIGFLLHYHVRWRVFRVLKRLIRQSGE